MSSINTHITLSQVGKLLMTLLLSFVSFTKNSQGRKHREIKDLEKRLNLNINSWVKLDNETRSYDYTSIDNIPELTSKIGNEIYLPRAKFFIS